jgi:5-methylcytosine-specific restriction endonuclease McrA
MKAKTKAYFRNKCDKLIQELGRQTYKDCLVCGKPYSCLHHYYPKSSAGNLRYHWENLIPLCAGCHLQHHCGLPDIQNKINKIKGEQWLTELRKSKQQDFKSNTLAYYKETYEKLYGQTKSD